MVSDNDKMSERELAAWMLEKMRLSEEFLEVLRKARAAGRPDALDTPDYVARHRGRLAHLYQDKGDAGIALPDALAERLEQIGTRDLVSCAEEVIEQALAAYLATRPKLAAAIDDDWPTSFAAAEAEIEGRSRGVFGPGFVKGLAQAGREERARLKEAERSREREGREKE